MESELGNKLGYEKSEKSPKWILSETIKSQFDVVQVKIPRDRNDEYEPQIIEKYNRNADGMEEKILSLYSCGMSQRDIEPWCA